MMSAYIAFSHPVNKFSSGEIGRSPVQNRRNRAKSGGQNLSKKVVVQIFHATKASMTRYVTIEQIKLHTGKHSQTVRAALKKASVKVIKESGIKGNRYEVHAVNRFLAKQWPCVQPMNDGQH